MNPKQKRDPLVTSTDYLGTLKKAGISPSFFMSSEYLDCKCLHWGFRGDLFGCWEEGEAGWFLPPLDGEGTIYDSAPCWACLPGKKTDHFLDYEFIYDPQQFLDLSGGRWSVFRKNVRKWINRTSGTIQYRSLVDEECCSEAAGLLESWASDRALYDPETLLRCAMQMTGRWGLFCDGRLVGLNVADQNWEFINYRLCVDNGDDFLQEYLRLLFYRSCPPGTMVNDGGCLGSVGLERFKRRLHPTVIRELYTNL